MFAVPKVKCAGTLFWLRFANIALDARNIFRTPRDRGRG
jgi:hypothetical protein